MGHYVRRSREERLQEIQMAALELYKDKGYNSTTKKDIIHANNLTKGGFNNYYKSKDEIKADLST
jgi:Transcriptional regulator